MKTTLDLPDPLFRELKSQAAKRGKKMKELIEDFVTQGLHGNQPPLQRSPLPPARPATGRVIPALNNTEIQEILDQEDGAH